jgi:STE24 endopeptidase
MNIFLFFSVCLVGKLFFETFLEFINKNHYENTYQQKQAQKTLGISPEDFHKTLEYTKDKFKLNIFSSWLGMFSLLGFVGLGGFTWLESLATNLSSYDTSSAINGAVFFLLLIILSSFLQLPISYYSTFYVEEKHGFNKQSKKLFFIDQIKSLVISLLLVSLLIYLILSAMNVGQYWWVLGWLVYAVFTFVLSWLFPTVLAPIFNKFSPLEDGELKQKIVALSKQVKFNLDSLYVMDASTRSSHGNAYFTGVFGKKRIVLFDTLVNKLNSDEIVAVLAHELGHFKLNHVRKSLIMSSVFMGVVFYALSKFMGIEEIYNAFGFTQISNHAALIVFSLFFSLIGIITTPIFSRLSRNNEFEADNFAYECFSDASNLVSALKKLSSENRSMPITNKFYSSFYYSHPPLLERIDTLEKISLK